MLGIIIIIFFASLSLTVHCLAERCTEIYCASEGHKSAECVVEDEIKRLEVSKQISASPCTRNETFDYIGNKVRVEKGCRANFTVCFVKHDDPEPDDPEPDKSEPDDIKDILVFDPTCRPIRMSPVPTLRYMSQYLWP